MRKSTFSKYIAIAGATLLPAACQVGPQPSEAAVYVSPEDLSGGVEQPTGTMPSTPSMETPPPPSSALTPPEEAVSPHPLRSVPETFEQVAPREPRPSLPAPPATPTREESAPTDGMPVLDQPARDGMPSLRGLESDPMPVVTPPLALLEERKEGGLPIRNGRH
jgi:hypothetical protein